MNNTSLYIFMQQLYLYKKITNSYNIRITPIN